MFKWIALVLILTQTSFADRQRVTLECEGRHDSRVQLTADLTVNGGTMDIEYPVNDVVRSKTVEMRRAYPSLTHAYYWRSVVSGSGLDATRDQFELSMTAIWFHDTHSRWDDVYVNLGRDPGGPFGGFLYHISVDCEAH